MMSDVRIVLSGVRCPDIELIDLTYLSYGHVISINQCPLFDVRYPMSLLWAGNGMCIFWTVVVTSVGPVCPMSDVHYPLSAYVTKLIPSGHFFS